MDISDWRLFDCVENLEKIEKSELPTTIESEVGSGRGKLGAGRSKMSFNPSSGYSLPTNAPTIK